MSRYQIGIDLGTTNCALSYVDRLQPDAGIQSFKILQWDDAGGTCERDTLPSFVMLPIKGEWQRGQLDLPDIGSEFDQPTPYLLGKRARDQALQQPSRVIHSAKSWLVDDRIDHDSGFLPWHSDQITGDKRLTAIQVQELYLRYLKGLWNHSLGAGSKDVAFDHQDITVTIPASFGESAQRRTLAAMAAAGYPSTSQLLEEPLAAFHFYLHTHPEILERDRRLLVIDIGGGTCDFSLFAVVAAKDHTLAHVNRLAVSEHILLGGDNIDLAIAAEMEKALGRTEALPGPSFAALVAEARRLKELVLSQQSQEDNQVFRIAVHTGGRSLFGSSKTVTIDRHTIIAIVEQTFYPFCQSDEVCHQGEGDQNRHGLADQSGLLYAQDLAFSRHLARFVNGGVVDGVLFAGGSIKPERVRHRLMDLLASWQGFRPELLASRDFDLMVTLGAAIARQQAHLIRGGYPRSIYLEVGRSDQDTTLVCIVAKGYDGQDPIKLDHLPLKLRLGESVVFNLYTATDRDRDIVGSFHSSQGLKQLPPLVTRLGSDDVSPANTESKQIDVHLEVTLSATGLLDLHCVLTQDPAQRFVPQFALTPQPASQFQVTSDQCSPGDQTGDRQLTEAQALVAAYFGKALGGSHTLEAAKSKNLIKTLEDIFGLPRSQWHVSTMRELWPMLAQGIHRRGRSLDHERSFLSLAGLTLRPGFGLSEDRFRIDQLWNLFDHGPCFAKDLPVMDQWWVMWRRVAGGLDKSRQERLFRKIYPAIKNNKITSPEMLLLAGALERIDVNAKVQLGQKLIEQLTQSKLFRDQKIWALARLANRSLLYAHSAQIVPPGVVEDWGQQLADIPVKTEKSWQRLALFYSHGGRLTQARGSDLSLDVRRAFYDRHLECQGLEHQRQPILEYVKLDRMIQNQEFGEELPVGLFLN